MNPGEILPRVDVAHRFRETIQMISRIQVGTNDYRFPQDGVTVEMIEGSDYGEPEHIATGRHGCLGAIYAPTDEHCHRGNVDLRLIATTGSVVDRCDSQVQD